VTADGTAGRSRLPNRVPNRRLWGPRIREAFLLAGIAILLTAPGLAAQPSRSTSAPVTSGLPATPHVGPAASVQPVWERPSSSSSSFPASADWPTYDSGVNHSGINWGEHTLSPSNASDLQLEWNVSLPGPDFSSPTVVNGTVYVGSWDGYEYALDASNGTEIWHHGGKNGTFIGQENFNGTGDCLWLNPMGVTSAAAVQGGVVYVGGGTIYAALNATTGDFVWHHNFTLGTQAQGYYAWSSPAFYRGSLYIGIASQCDEPLVQGGVVRLNASTGASEATFYSTTGIGASVWSSPTIDPSTNTLWITTGNGGEYGQSIIALNATTLALKGYWPDPSQHDDSDYGAGATLLSTPSGTTLAVATNKDGWASAVNASNLSSTGQTGLAWRDQTSVFPGALTCHLDGVAIAPAAFDGKYVYLPGAFSTVDGVNVNGSVRAAYAANGTYAWQTPTNGVVMGGAVGGNGLVVDVSTQVLGLGNVGGCETYGGYNNSWLQVLDAANGSVLFEQHFPYYMPVAPSISDGRIYVSAGTANTSGWTTMPDHLGHVFAFGLPVESEPSLVSGAWNLSGQVQLVVQGNGGGGSPNYTCSFGWAGVTSLRSGSPVANGSTCGPQGRETVTYAPANGTFLDFGNVTDAFGPVASASFSVEISLETICNRTSCTSTQLFQIDLPGGPPSGCHPTNCITQTWAINLAYRVTLRETGLPLGTDWSAGLNRTTLSSRTPYINFSEPNGSYPYAVDPLPSFLVTPVSGNVSVAGMNQTVPIVFNETFEVTVAATGRPSNLQWWFNWTGGLSAPGLGDSLSLSEPNGTYAYTVATSDPTYSAPAGSFSVAGAPVSVPVMFSRVTFTVTFLEAGLPGGTTWSVDFAGVDRSGSGGLVFGGIANGTYEYTVAPLVNPGLRGYVPIRSAGTVSVFGGPVTVSVAFQLASSGPPPSGSTIFGLPPIEGYALLGGLIAAFVVAAALAVFLSRRRRAGT
jgi:outer membrane protein assembly factor BamB